MASPSSVSGGVPPGFRFHPTDEELLHYYLKKKVAFERFELDVIREVDLNKMEPWELQERCRIGSTTQSEWYFFSHKDKKYPTSSRTNRATNAGFWKATGRDKCIRNIYKKIGMRKTLVFYRGRAPHGQKTDWIMHEYRLEDEEDDTNENGIEEGWVVCRIFKKKNYFKLNDGGGEGNITSQGDNENHMKLMTKNDFTRQPYYFHHQVTPQHLNHIPTNHHYSQFHVHDLIVGHHGHQWPSYDFSPREAMVTPNSVHTHNVMSWENVGMRREENDWTLAVQQGRIQDSNATTRGGKVDHLEQIERAQGEIGFFLGI